MKGDFRIFPEHASHLSWQVDTLFLFEVLISGFFVTLIAGLVIYFSLKYRRRSEFEIPPYTRPNPLLELTYIVIPFGLMMIMYVWGGYVFINAKRPPANAMQINVVGKQWMWKVQHPEGPREINMLHVPMGRPIKLVMTSQDVIHDFGIPAFRIKQDVVPGSYSTEWFEADTAGEYHLFCDQYCGDLHSRMIGTMVVMEPSAYQAWLSGVIPDQAPAVVGFQLFQSYGCSACHGQRAPTLAGLYMSKVLYFERGSKVLKETIADEGYLRESIVEPAAKIVAGYGPIMPTFAGQLSEEQIFDLIEYIKSLGVAQDNSIPGASPAGPQTRPSTQPAGGYRPDLLPNQPPARVPPSYNQTGTSPPPP
jgi:cytochrome c oxidase subunit 2